MTPDPRLLVQATPELLEGWCGPVVYDGVPATVRDGELFYRSTWDDGLHCSDTDSEIQHAHLDLSRAECRDRMVFVLSLAIPSWTIWGGDDTFSGDMVVPALAALDPNDDTRLPDGSRLVDALALAEVWRAVGGAR